MFDAKKLTKDQVAQLHGWAEEGSDLADLQKKLDEELGIKVTYMETRFLVDDLKIEIKKEEEPEPEPEEEEPAAKEGAEESPIPDEEAAPASDDPNSVTVTIDKLQRPGTIVSGKAVFGGTETIEWWMDQMGQLGMNPENEDFRPSPEQQMAFQQELQKAAAREGL